MFVNTKILNKTITKPFALLAVSKGFHFFRFNDSVFNRGEREYRYGRKLVKKEVYVLEYKSLI